MTSPVGQGGWAGMSTRLKGRKVKRKNIGRIIGVLPTRLHSKFLPVEAICPYLIGC